MKPISSFVNSQVVKSNFSQRKPEVNDNDVRANSPKSKSYAQQFMSGVVSLVYRHRRPLIIAGGVLLAGVSVVGAIALMRSGNHSQKGSQINRLVRSVRDTSTNLQSRMTSRSLLSFNDVENTKSLSVINPTPDQTIKVDDRFRLMLNGSHIFGRRNLTLSIPRLPSGLNYTVSPNLNLLTLFGNATEVDQYIINLIARYETENATDSFVYTVQGNTPDLPSNNPFPLFLVIIWSGFPIACVFCLTAAGVLVCVLIKMRRDQQALPAQLLALQNQKPVDP